MFRIIFKRRKRGVVAVQVLVTLPVLMGLAAVTVDVGMMYNTRTDLQRSADAGALAAIGVLAYGNPDTNSLAAATQSAKEFVESNSVMGQMVTIEPETDVVFGRAHFDMAANAYNFVPGEAPANAVQVTVRHTENSPNGPAPLYFAGIFGKSLTNISASAVAMSVNTHFDEVDNQSTPAEGQALFCHAGGDKDDSDDSASGDSDDSDDSDEGDAFKSDSESQSDPNDSDSPHTILADSGATLFFLQGGDELGPCNDRSGDSDDSDDSASGDSVDSDDSDPGDSDGSFDGDSDDSDDSASGDSDDSDDSEPGGFDNPDDSDQSDSGESQANSNGSNGPATSLVCHIPPGNPDDAHTITVSSAALVAHMAHGDTMGVCPGDVRIFLIK